MLQTQSRKIGDRTYHVTQLAAEPGQRLFFQLIKLAGPSIAALLREWDAKEISIDTVGGALTELTSMLTYAQFRDFVDTFTAVTAVEGADGARVPLDKMKTLAFAGDYGGLCRWLGFCLEVNFASFFDDMGLTRLPGAAATASASRSPTGSAG